MNTSDNFSANVELTSSKKKTLRGLGHHLEPIVYVGKEGLSKPLQQSVEAAFKAHELIKIKLGQNCPLERGSAGEQLAQLSKATLVQVIGRMVLLYRPNPDLPAAKRIEW
ncbi:MAG: ribosome assembly RNA-binding protein YhbY [Desulfobulbus sp.]